MGTTNLDELQLGTGLGTSSVADLAITTPKLANGAVTNAKKAEASAEETLHFFLPGAQTVGVKKAAAILGKPCTITDVRAYADTAPTGAALLVDANINGVTAFTTQANRPTIAAAANASSTTAPDVTAIAAGDRITVDVDQVGSVVAGSDLYVSVTIKRAHVA